MREKVPQTSAPSTTATSCRTTPRCCWLWMHASTWKSVRPSTSSPTCLRKSPVFTSRMMYFDFLRVASLLRRRGVSFGWYVCTTSYCFTSCADIILLPLCVFHLTRNIRVHRYITRARIEPPSPSRRYRRTPSTPSSSGSPYGAYLPRRQPGGRSFTTCISGTQRQQVCDHQVSSNAQLLYLMFDLRSKFRYAKLAPI